MFNSQMYKYNKRESNKQTKYIPIKPTGIAYITETNTNTPPKTYEDLIARVLCVCVCERERYILSMVEHDAVILTSPANIPFVTRGKSHLPFQNPHKHTTHTTHTKCISRIKRFIQNTTPSSILPNNAELTPA